MGLYLGYVAERAGSIRPSMFAHFFNNTVVVIFTWYVGRQTIEGAGVGGPAKLQAMLVEAAGCLVVLALCCLYLKYRVYPPDQARIDAAHHAFPVA